MAGEGALGKNTGLVKSTQKKNLEIKYGRHTTVDADDTVATGLSEVLAVCATLESDPVAGAQFVTAHLSSTAGSIDIQSWKATATADTALIAATTFGKTVSWIAVGTVA